TGARALARRGAGGAAGTHAAGEPDDGGRTGLSAREQDVASRRVAAQVVDDDGEPVEGGRVALRCLHDDEVAPIADAIVALDEQGRFAAPGCLGVICVELFHPSLRPAHPWVLELGRPAVLQATGLARLHGSVVDGRGEPVVAARIVLRAPPDADPEAVLPTVAGSTSTDGDGVFSIARVERPPCDPCTEASSGCDEAPLRLHDHLWVSVHADGFAPARVAVELGETGDVELEPIRLVAAAEVLSGTVVDPRGAAYPRAEVYARPSETGRDAPVLEQHHADVQGDSFAFESLGPGPYELRVLQDGVELARSAAVRPGDDIALRGDRLAVGPDVEVLITRDGVPLAGVRVDGGPFRGASTDALGLVRAQQAMPGDYILRVRSSGSPTVEHALHVDPDTTSAGPAPAPGAAAAAGGASARVLRVHIALPA
ncbi:MAG: carboxypeptidase-like regulatory domain-containing protein, partial [Nannocystaceae bacterium]|nr:carboxypeptidase-like regulatory domain-containing protein [Nannocystaceae bacterium]